MERDVLCSHAAARTLGEKLFNHSDGYYVYVCAECGNYATAVNHKERLFECRICQDSANIMQVPSSWSSKLLFHEMQSSQIGIKFIMKPPVYQDYDDWDQEDLENLNEEED